MPTHDPHPFYLGNLVRAFLSGEWTQASLRRQARLAAGKSFRWIPALVGRVLKEFPSRPGFDRLIDFLSRDKGIKWINENIADPVWTIFPEMMTPPPAAAGDVQLPQIATERILAEFLGVTSGRLLWYADPQGRNRKHSAGPLRTYRYRWVAKSRGRARLLEIPKIALKQMQRKILSEILNRIPAHPAVHGFRAGLSIATNAGPHCGKSIVVRFDLADFFPSVSAIRVYRIFRTFGYPECVARLLMGLCTTSIPRDVWESRPGQIRDGSDHSIEKKFIRRHLPQGAPTSPAIANLAAFRLDCRLSKLAAALGADYTRYADDLAFSGGEEFARGLKRFAALVAVIVLEEGFTLNYRKTRIMRKSSRQQVAGVVVNAKPNVPRVEYDRLKAILTNCIRQGPTAQNRERHPDFRAHLLGRLAHLAAINPEKGKKLRMLFERIVWERANQDSRDGEKAQL